MTAFAGVPFADSTFADGQRAAGGGTTFNSDFSETVSSTDVLTVSSSTFGASVSDTVTVADVLSSSVVFASSLSDSLTVTDVLSATLNGNIYNSSLSDSIAVVDVLTVSSSTFGAVVADSTAIADVLSATGGIVVVTTKGGAGKGKNLTLKQKKKLKTVVSQEWLKAEETVKNLLSDRFIEASPKQKLETLNVHVESLAPLIEALKKLTTTSLETAQEVKQEEVTEKGGDLLQTRLDSIEKQLRTIEDLITVVLAHVI